MSYLLLLAVTGTASLVPPVGQPIYRVMEPLNEFMIGGTMWVAGKVSGNAKEEPALIEAVEESDFRRAQKLIAKGADVNQQNSYGYSALHVAAASGDAKVVKLLLEAGANVNARNPTGSALARAAQQGNAEIVRLLLQAGADVEAKDDSGWTPLFSAAMTGGAETVEVLLRAGVNINARANNGWTALKEAQMRGNENIVQQLKAAGAIDFADGSR
jgi:ankyrin repeat protein